MELNYRGSGLVFYNQTEYECNLHTNKKQGGILIQIIVNKNHPSFLEIPLNINFLTGELNTGYRFSLVNCTRESMQDMMAEGRSIFSYRAQFMFEGFGGKNGKNIKFSKVYFELSNIIEWGNISGYKIGENFEISPNKNTTIDILENDKFKIEYIVENDMLPVILDETLKEKLILNQSGNILISLKEEDAIEQYYYIFEKVKRLIEISKLENIHLNRISGFSKEIFNMYGDRKIEEQIEIISSYLNKEIETDDKHISSKNWKWINLPDLIENKSFENYFDKYEVLEPIIELYLEIISATKMSSIRVFLNVVQALETYHSRFKANNIEEFKYRIENIILKNRPQSFIENDKKFLMANSKTFITLESRIADLLLAEFNIYFDTGDIKHLDFPNVISKTRNYYIHYDETIKNNNRVLTEKELHIYNGVLLYMLEYYILLELGFSNVDKIKDKLKERWGDISTRVSILEESKKREKENLSSDN